jgi:hypothetical protein
MKVELLETLSGVTYNSFILVGVDASSVFAVSGNTEVTPTFQNFIYFRRFLLAV